MPKLYTDFNRDEPYRGLMDAIQFELKSSLGRMFSKSNRRSDKTLIQIGSGLNHQEEFENIDFYAFRFWKIQHVSHDLRYKLPFGDDCFLGAYSEHTLEHLQPGYALFVMREVLRVLKKGAVFRLSVPDLGKYISYYNGEKNMAGFDQFSAGHEAIWSLTQNYAHQSVWDFNGLSQALLDAGFEDVRLCDYRTGSDARLLIDQEDRKWESLYVEALK